MTFPERLKVWTDNGVPALACMVLLHAQPVPLQSCTDSPDKAASATRPAEPRLHAFVETLRTEGAIEKLEACRYRDACLTVTPVFAGFTAADKAAIASLIRRSLGTSLFPGDPVASVRFIEAETGRELGEYRAHRLIWRDGRVFRGSGPAG